MGPNYEKLKIVTNSKYDKTEEEKNLNVTKLKKENVTKSKTSKENKTQKLKI